MAPRFQPVDATLGARVSDVDLRNLTEADWDSIQAAFIRHGVLIFSEQFLSQDEQVAFALGFGELELFDGEGLDPSRTGKPMIAEISNVDSDGRHLSDPTDPRVRYRTANEGWHSDSSFKQASAKASVLAAIEVPTQGGETGFADMRAAYDALPADVAETLSHLNVWHSLEYAQARAGAVDEQPAGDPFTWRGAFHPLIRRHSESGRKSLFIGRHACAIDGMDLATAEALLQDLLAEACKPPRTFLHHWRVGDVVVWDNRCILHRASEYDLHERRRMRHVRVAGSPWK